MKKAVAVLLLTAGSLVSAFAGKNVYANSLVYGSSPVYLSIGLPASGVPEMRPDGKIKDLIDKIPDWVWVMIADFISEGLEYILNEYGQSSIDEACTCYEEAKNAPDEPDDNPGTQNFSPTAGGGDWGGLEELCG